MRLDLAWLLRPRIGHSSLHGVKADNPVLSGHGRDRFRPIAHGQDDMLQKRARRAFLPRCASGEWD